MTAAFSKFRYLQVAESLRDMIRTECRVGELLTSEADLADKFTVAPYTIRQALDMLVEEGWIHRYQGRGTVIADRLLTGEFAIALHPQSFTVESSPYWRSATMALVKELRRRNRLFRINIHLGQETTETEDFPATLDLLDPQVFKRLRAVFTFASMTGLDEELRAKGVPVVSLAPQSKYRVFFDYHSVADLSIQRLHAAGCRTVGILCGRYAKEWVDWRIDEAIRQKAAALGIKIRPEWIPYHEQEFMTERSGAKLFDDLWASSERPEGLIIVDDMLCRGALRSIRDAGLEIPRDLKIVTQAIRDAEVPYRKALSRVEFDPYKQVHIAVDMMIELLAGREPASREVLIPGEYMEGETV